MKQININETECNIGIFVIFTYGNMLFFINGKNDKMKVVPSKIVINERNEKGFLIVDVSMGAMCKTPKVSALMRVFLILESFVVRDDV